VLLGASNVVLSISIAIESARLVWGQPLEILAAMGHGRSFGTRSWVLGRSLEGITTCGLWEELARRPSLPTVGVVTDIGNDLLYEVQVEQIAQWVERCLVQLFASAESVVVTQLPMENVNRLRPLTYLLMRTVLFPRCRLDLRTMIERARQLNEGVSSLAQRYGAHVVEPCPSWYGFDPIHIKMRHRSEAWKFFFTARRWSIGSIGEPFLPTLAVSTTAPTIAAAPVRR